VRAEAFVPPPFLHLQTQQSSVEETKWIAYRWAKQLPSFELEDKMCSIFEEMPENSQSPVDAWGTPFRVRCDRSSLKYVFLSAGADQTFETADDILVIRSSHLMRGYSSKP
jgi:uncharacterized protein (UPF0262 family)